MAGPATAQQPRRPPRLVPGARVAVIAPSSPVTEPSQLQRGVAVLRELGFEVVLAPGVGEARGYLAGGDARRAQDLLWALGDPQVDAVWCARGGYGAQRTVAAIDPGALDALTHADPKPFVGFSDVTVLHALITQRLHWVTFYGPSVTSLGARDPYTLQGVHDALLAAEPFTVAPHPDDPWVSTLCPGRAEGELAGGCLTLLAALAGTSGQVDFAERICFFEEVGEEVYAIDRCLSQLLAAGCFERCRGILIGEHADTRASGPASLGLETVFADLLGPLEIPCCFYLPIGHGEHLATLPIGARARLDADAGTLSILRAPVG